ncbi:MAG: glutamate--tRNA ligase family protein, partial [Caldimonas sp.]
IAGADTLILSQLAACGLLPDEPPVWQSRREPLYEAALQRLLAAGWAYPCGCTRRDLVDAAALRGAQRSRHGELVYPGTCRRGLRGRAARAARVLATPTPDRFDEPLTIAWTDRRLGVTTQNVSREVGDFVVRRADGFWAYQLAVVVDDAAQGITDVVRGEDLADNTPRQIHLQRLLGLPTPRHLHVALVLGDDGEKLSKQNGAIPFDMNRPLSALREAGTLLALDVAASDLSGWLAEATARWRARWVEVEGAGPLTGR